MALSPTQAYKLAMEHQKKILNMAIVPLNLACLQGGYFSPATPILLLHIKRSFSLLSFFGQGGHENGEIIFLQDMEQFQFGS